MCQSPDRYDNTWGYEPYWVQPDKKCQSPIGKVTQTYVLTNKEVDFTCQSPYRHVNTKKHRKYLILQLAKSCVNPRIGMVIRWS